MPLLFNAHTPHPWLKPGVLVGGLVPLVVIAVRGLLGRIGADPVAIVLNQLGYLALVCLTASLLCTPLKIVTGWTWGLQVRKLLGLMAFFYALLHFLTYLLIDQALNFAAIYADVTQRNFILVGFLALLLLVPLAVTSTAGMIRRLGAQRWKRLHQLAYLAGILGAIHFLWRVKSDQREPLIFAGLIVLGFALRALALLAKQVKKWRAT